jgi:hypothetical protein
MGIGGRYACDRRSPAFLKPSCGFDNRPVADNAAYRRDFMRPTSPGSRRRRYRQRHCRADSSASGETDWLIHIASNEDRIHGITGWVDLAGGECDYDALLACPKVVGIRAQLRRIADDTFVAKPDVVSNLDAALRAGLSVTILAEARHYQHLRDVLPQLADGPVIINHLALPFPEVDRDAWRATLRAFAARPQTYVQLSGLPFLYGPRWRDGDARSLLDDAFAPRPAAVDVRVGLPDAVALRDVWRMGRT